MIILFALFVLNTLYTLAMQRPVPAIPAIGLVSLVVFMILETIYHPLIGIIFFASAAIFIVIMYWPEDKMFKGLDTIFYGAAILGSASILFSFVEAITGRLF